MAKTNWNDVRSYQPSILRISDVDCSALFLLYDNSCRMSNESNLNVEMATVSPNIWFDDIVDTILEYVDFISKSSTFMLTFFDKSNLNQITSMSCSCDIQIFDTLENLLKFIKNTGNFSTLVVFSITKCVDLESLKVGWTLRFKNINDPKQIRNKKIEYLTNGHSEE